MLLRIDSRRSVREVAAAMSVADICGLCKRAFATQPGLCEYCAATPERRLTGEEGWRQDTHGRPGIHLPSVVFRLRVAISRLCL